MKIIFILISNSLKIGSTTFWNFKFSPNVILKFSFRIPISNSYLIHRSLVVVGLVWKWEVTNNNNELLTLLLCSFFSYSSLLLNLFLSSSCMVSFSLIYIKIPIYLIFMVHSYLFMLQSFLISLMFQFYILGHRLLLLINSKFSFLA